MSQMLHFSTRIGSGGHRGLEEGNRNLGKRLEWRDRDET